MQLPESFSVEVTKEDIDDGIPSHVRCCPIAIAVKRTLGPETRVAVTSRYAQVYGNEPRRYSHDAFAFVVAFDEGDSVSPRTVNFTKVAV